jgi:hypothetical protein
MSEAKQKLPVMTTMRQMIGVTGNMITVGPWHDHLDTHWPTILKPKNSPINSL